MEDPTIELGFIETIEAWRLQSQYFPSKVGGKPAWLNLKDLPPSSELQCGICSQPMILLLQIYAPVDDLENCFHRTLFVFLCKNADCCKPNCADNVAVFRCQLARKNSFYSYEPPAEIENAVGPAACDYHNLCYLCGCWGPKRCARCQTNYCSVHHQRIDWKMGHKEICKEGSSSMGNTETSKQLKYVLPEYEIVTETEVCGKPMEKEAKVDRTDEERMKEYEEYVKKLEMKKSFSTEPSAVQDRQDLEDMAVSKIDKHFRKFQERIQHEPDQILRYQRGGTPLWVSKENIPTGDSIPPCDCGANRQFEFQILPQLLNYLKLDELEKSIDWGTLLVYSCSKNCDYKNRGYHRECIYKQDFSSDIKTGTVSKEDE